MAADLLKQAVLSGISPLELELHPVRSPSSRRCFGFRAVLKINSIDLGVLYPEQYRMVTNRNMQCVRLSMWSLRTALDILGNTDVFISVYTPVKLLKRPELAAVLDSAAQSGAGLNRLVLELSSDILLNDEAETVKLLEKIKSYGVRLMLSGFGDEFCPLLRLNGLPFDMVVLDKSLCSMSAIGSLKTASVIQLITGLNMEPVLETADSDELIDSAFDKGCVYFVDRHYLPQDGALFNA